MQHQTIITALLRTLQKDVSIVLAGATGASAGIVMPTLLELEQATARFPALVNLLRALALR